jgi:predicted GIY-YIG superfamily endonuclease
MPVPTGYIYFLKLSAPLGNENHRASHYIGWAKNLNSLQERINQHRTGSPHAAAFTRAAAQRGITFEVVLVVRGSRDDERRYKNRKKTAQVIESLRKQGLGCRVEL